jgi:hypothetical protein
VTRPETPTDPETADRLPRRGLPGYVPSPVPILPSDDELSDLAESLGFDLSDAEVTL